MDAVGKFSYEHVYIDTNVEQIESLPSTAWHRHVDLEIVKADNEGSCCGFWCSIGIQTLHRLCKELYYFTFDDLWSGNWQAC